MNASTLDVAHTSDSSEWSVGSTCKNEPDSNMSIECQSQDINRIQNKTLWQSEIIKNWSKNAYCRLKLAR